MLGVSRRPAPSTVDLPAGIVRGSSQYTRLRAGCSLEGLPCLSCDTTHVTGTLILHCVKRIISVSNPHRRGEPCGCGDRYTHDEAARQCVVHVAGPARLSVAVKEKGTRTSHGIHWGILFAGWFVCLSRKVFALTHGTRQALMWSPKSGVKTFYFTDKLRPKPHFWYQQLKPNSM